MAVASILPITATERAIKSFVGYLEGTGHAAQTISSYRSDLGTFSRFLEKELAQKPVRLEHLSRKDLSQYSEFLSIQGFKSNTRRRKLLTLKRFLTYLSRRKKLKLNPSEQLPAPYKVERIPKTLDADRILTLVRSLPAETLFLKRNRALLWTLFETGCLVSELPRIKKSSVLQRDGKSWISFEGKSPRQIEISQELGVELESLTSGDSHLFTGFNKYGSLGGPITPRGIELLVKHYAAEWDSPDLTPRMIRHSTVVLWHRMGHSQDEIQKRLGLKTDYAFRTYQPLFKASKKDV